MSRFDEFPIGSVAYYVKKLNNKWLPAFGIVTDYASYDIELELYDLADNRLIDDIPIQDIEFPTKWQKLPKGWTYDTELFSLTWSSRPEEINRYKITSPGDILKAIEEGILVKVQNKDYGRVESEIDAKKGWRILKKYYSSDYRSSHITTPQVYKTYDEVKTEIDKRDAELRRQAELSDYDWSVEKIDEALARWSHTYHIDDETKEKYRQRILNFGNVEDIEVRIFSGQIQWKYWKNKRWHDIDLGEHHD